MIAREGWLPIALCLVAGGAIVYASGAAWSAPAWLAALWLAGLFYAPRRVAPDAPLGVVSPLDGRVIAVGEVDDPWQERRALGISLRLSFPGVSVVYSPVSGRITDYWTDRGDAAAMAPGTATRGGSPTRYALGFETDAGDVVVYCLRSARPHSRFKLDQAPGERAARGRRSGFVYFASTAEVLVPLNARHEVSVGDRVTGASTTLASLVRA